MSSSCDCLHGTPTTVSTVAQGERHESKTRTSGRIAWGKERISSLKLKLWCDVDGTSITYQHQSMSLWYTECICNSYNRISVITKLMVSWLITLAISYYTYIYIYIIWYILHQFTLHHIIIYHISILSCNIIYQYIISRSWTIDHRSYHTRWLLIHWWFSDDRLLTEPQDCSTEVKRLVAPILHFNITMKVLTGFVEKAFKKKCIKL